MKKLCVYIPSSHLDVVKTAMFGAGGGNIGDYDQCCWQCVGQGQFRPLAGSQPFLGEQGKCEYVEEYRVELVCDDTKVKAVVQALKDAHPYEEPAYDVSALEDF